MRLWLKVMWVITILVNLSGVIWFVLGSTANFQRGIDLISTVILVYLGIPSILLIVVSSFLLLKKWSPARWWEVIGVFMIMTAMLVLTPHLYKNVETSGWLTEKLETDSIQQTSDQRYMYCLELINLFQQNGSARLYLKNANTREELRIAVDLPLTKIQGISWGEVPRFIKLEPTNDANIYILHTTESFPIPNEKFEIHIQEKTSVKIG
ncbi:MULTISPECIES: hypothetical protein [Brevibacillus]|uniref:hypothetical protein n=1 Tax=Brevibacillus TaxID=55080 RepID=UPI000ED61A25|nr:MULTISPECIES: hypothetical protein [Brevibacillus]MBU8714734.1 hypothetical protein [Brevibacillus parabrevis]MED2253303.1 hypothetical protein [Brevibacillus parabrevis]NRQ55662.1 hypothetical protein [Brevibacillus sp. HD1.4A]HBZ80143.1 hypothetical protein [Brevibacillus sp.]